MIDKCYEGMATIPQRINDPCGGNPISTNCVQSPVANPYLNLAEGATQTQINAALSSALIYKDSQIATISNQPPLQLKTVGGKSLLGSGDIPFPSGGTKTKGAITATNNYPSDEVVLIYDYNEVTAPTGDGYVVLPDTDLIGREVIVFAKNTTNNIFVQVNQAYPSKLVGGSGGIDSNTDFLKIKPNESYRFLSLEDDYWFYENITSDVATLQSVVDAGSVFTKTDEGTTIVTNMFDANPDAQQQFTTMEKGLYSSDVRQYADAFRLQVDNGIGNSVLIVHSALGYTINVRNGAFSITTKFKTPIASTNLFFPAKSIAGDYRMVVEPDTTYTVATLPAGVLGDIAIVTDALSPVYTSTVVGGGTVVLKVWHNGTNWICN